VRKGKRGKQPVPECVHSLRRQGKQGTQKRSKKKKKFSVGHRKDKLGKRVGFTLLPGERRTERPQETWGREPLSTRGTRRMGAKKQGKRNRRKTQQGKEKDPPQSTWASSETHWKKKINVEMGGSPGKANGGKKPSIQGTKPRAEQSRS